MVFASLVEYAVVSYLNKKMAQQRERRRKLGEQAAPVEMPVFYNHAALKGTMVCNSVFNLLLYARIILYIYKNLVIY